MTLAVVVATEKVEDGDSIVAVPTAALNASPAGAERADETPAVLDRLLGQLAALGVAECRIIVRRELAPALRKMGHEHEVIESDDLAGDLRAISTLVRGARRPVLLVHADVVAHTEQLARVMLGNKAAATAIIARGRPGAAPPMRPLVRAEGGRVASAGSPYHQVTSPNGVFLGVLWVSAAQTARLAALATDLADLVETPGALPEVDPIRVTEHDGDGRAPDEAKPPKQDTRDPAFVAELSRLRVTPATGADAPALLLVGLARSGVRVTTRRAYTLRCERVLTQDEADAAVRGFAMVDEDHERLSAAVKSNDGFFTTFAVSTYSRYIARWAARRGLTPNMVTTFSMALSVVAAVAFGTGQRLGMVAGGLLLYFAFVFDCVDGQLARYSRQFSTLGAWLDATFDRAKEYVVFAGLAVGSTAAAVSSPVHAGDVWALALAAMIVQTSRHMVDFSYGAARRRTTPQPVTVVPLTAPDDRLLDRREDGGKARAPATATATATATALAGARAESRPAAPATAAAPASAAAPATATASTRAAAPTATARTKGRAAGLGGLVAMLSTLTDRIPGIRWAKKIIVLPIGERFALISLTAAVWNARVTFIALLAWGTIAFLYTATGRILRSLST